MVRDAFPAWTRRPVGLLLLALLLGACGAASAEPRSDASSSSQTVRGVERATLQPCFYGGTAIRKVVGAQSGPATAGSGAIRLLEAMPAASDKLAVAGAAPATAAAVQVPASGTGATMKVATPAGAGATRVADVAAPAHAAEACS